MVENIKQKEVLRKKILSYKPDFNREILEIGLDKFHTYNCSGGNYILKAGSMCESVFFIENSITRCFFVGEDGEEKTIWLEPEMSFVTDYESFSSKKSTRCDICCYQNTTVYAIDKPDLFMLYAKYHEWTLIGILIMEEQFVKLLKLRNMISFNSASENYELLESYFSTYLNVVPLKHLASWFNISPVHLSRIRKERSKINGN